MLIKFYFAWRASVFYFLLHFIEIYKIHTINICFLMVIIILKLLQIVQSFLMNLLGFFHYHFAVVFFRVLITFQASVVECFVLIDIQVYLLRGRYFRFLLLDLIK